MRVASPSLPRSTLLPTLLLAAALPVGACAGADADDTEHALPEWSLVEELRMGSVDDPDYAFTMIGGLELGPDGSLYTLHPRDAEIRRWTADGEPAGSVGRQGEGPGEFVAPARMGWRGDTLWVFDQRQYRVTYFGPDGTHHRDVTLNVDLGSREQAAENIYPARPETMLGDQTVYAVTPAFSHAVMQGDITEIAHVRTTHDGTPLDTLAVLPAGPENTLRILRDDGGIFSAVFSAQPFADGPLSTLSADRRSLLLLDRTATADTEGRTEYRLQRVDLSGDTTLDRTYAYTPQPIPSEKVDSVVESRASSLHESLGESWGWGIPRWTSAVRDAMHVPDHHPPVRAVRGGRDGTIWLHLTAPEVAGNVWQVLDREGEPLARVVTPAGFRLLESDRESLWGVERDELDVEYLVRYRTTFADGAEGAAP